MAVRFKCPIFTYEFILKEAGIILEEESGTSEKKAAKSPVAKPKKKKKGIDSLNTSELNEKLQQAIDTENYEEASRLRDEINKRSGKSN